MSHQKDLERLPLRLRKKIKVVGPCWIWTGAKTLGYGRAWDGKKVRPTHQIIWELLRGQPVPEGKELDHLCRVRSCQNPLHLEPVTSRENSLRGIGPAAIHARLTHCPQGHPYDGQNTKWRTDSRGRKSRQCKICQRAYVRDWQRRYGMEYDRRRAQTKQRQEYRRAYREKNREEINRRKREARARLKADS